MHSQSSKLSVRKSEGETLIPRDLQVALNGRELERCGRYIWKQCGKKIPGRVMRECTDGSSAGCEGANTMTGSKLKLNESRSDCKKIFGISIVEKI